MHATVYALANRRDRTESLKFLDCFLPARRASVDSYEYPEFAPSALFQSLDEILDRLTIDTHESYSLFFHRRNDSEMSQSVSIAMLIFLEDGSLILGVELDIGVDIGMIEGILREFVAKMDSKMAYVTGEEAPPWTIEEFQRNLREC